METSLKHSTASGVLWNFTEKLLSRGFSVVVTLLLAWFLTPEDYGIVAMIAVFISISQALVDGGLGQALIRKSDADNWDFDTVFYTNIAMSFFVYSVLFFTAPAIAGFYDQTELVAIIRVAALAVFGNAMFVVQQSILQKKMLFKKQLKVQLPAVMLSGILAIFMAFFDFGVWALIAQIVTNAFFIAIFYWRLNLWRPSVNFSFNRLKSLFAFSSFLLMETLLSVPFKNMYNIVLPKFFATSTVGLYFFASKIKDIILQQLVQAISTVVYPALSTIQNDKVLLKSGFRKVISMMSFLLTPFLLVLAALAEPIFNVLFPQKWFDAVPFIQLLCISAIMNPLAVININIMKVVGKSHLIFYVGLYKKIVGISIFAGALLFNDILIVLYGQIIHSLLAYIPNSYYSAKLIDYSAYEQLADFAPSLLLSGIVAGTVFILQLWTQWSSLVELVVFGVMAILLYLLGAHILKLQTYEMAKELVIKKMKVDINN